MEDIILVGFGGHGKSVADCIEREKRFRIAGYTDNKEQLCGYPYLGTDQELFCIYYIIVKEGFYGIDVLFTSHMFMG